jgi:SAM-dependent methyltransferase
MSLFKSVTSFGKIHQISYTFPIMKNKVTGSIKRAARYVIPDPTWRWLRSRYQRWKSPDDTPPTGAVDFGDFRRLTPISTNFGAERGTIIDRYYIEAFLGQHRGNVRGGVLEIGDNCYTLQFGDDKVNKSDVLHVEAGNPLATIVADLTSADEIPSDSFDCIIFTQTIQMIYDIPAAMHHLYRMLKPGGVLLMTTHGISKVGRRLGKDSWCVYWRMTEDSVQRLFSESFQAENVSVQGYGNIFAATAFLYGLAAEELTPEELDTYDPDYQVLVAARGVKAPGLVAD